MTGLQGKKTRHRNEWVQYANYIPRDLGCCFSFKLKNIWLRNRRESHNIMWATFSEDFLFQINRVLIITGFQDSFWIFIGFPLGKYLRKNVLLSATDDGTTTISVGLPKYFYIDCRGRKVFRNLINSTTTPWASAAAAAGCTGTGKTLNYPSGFVHEWNV